MTEINSKAYWNKRFIEDWEAHFGPNQSRFFARLAIQNLPTWLVTLLRKEPLTLADWGCAQGDGTDEWATYLNAQRLSGIDFSSVAIEQATKRYPDIRFVAENWLLGDNTKRDKYDIVFSSNVMEHFHKPFDVLQVLCKRATKGVVLALPYREMDRHAEHFFTFLAENVPLGLPNNFRLVWSQVVDCRHISNTYWIGEQIVLVYANAKWIDKLNLSLNDCLVEHEDVSADKTQLNSVLKERDGQLAAINLTHAERERELQDHLLTVRNNLRQVEQTWLERSRQQESIYITERDGLRAKLDESQQALLATKQEKTEQLQSHAERERELQDHLLTVRNELLQSEQAWIEKAEQQDIHYATERTGFQIKLDELQQALLATEREKTEQLQSHAERERELQDHLLTVRNELLQSEQVWIEKAEQQDIHYATERTGFQIKLDELQQALLATEREKTEQLQSHAERERELQDHLLTVRNELLQSEQAWTEKAEQQDIHYAVERTGFQIKLDELQQALLATEQEKTEQLQSHAERERELQDHLLTVRNELLQSEQAWTEKAEQQDIHYAVERTGFQIKLDELQQALLATEQEKTEQLQSHAERERELQDHLLTVRNELLQSEQASIEKAEQTRVYSEQLESLEKTAQEWKSTATALQLKIDSLLQSKFWRMTASFRKFSGSPSEVGDTFKPKTASLTNDPFGSEATLIPTHKMTINQLTMTNSAEKAPNMNHQLIQHEITHIEDLLNLYDEPFICEAYRALLGRHPDPEGLAYYLKKLRRGTNKLDILRQLKTSKETKSLVNGNIQGLNPAIRRHRLSQLPLMGWLKPSRESIDNRLRIIENRLFAMQNFTNSSTLQVVGDTDNSVQYPKELINIYQHGDTAELVTHLRQRAYTGIFVMGSRCMGWHEAFKQRTHHIADFLMESGYLVLCAMNPIYKEDITECISRDQENLFIVNFDDRAIWSQIVDLLAIESKAPLFYHLVGTEPGTTLEEISHLKKVGYSIVYDYIDEISKEILPGLPDLCLIRHEYLLKDPATLVITTADNLYHNVTKYRNENVILSPNAVRLEDWILEPDAPIPQEIAPIVRQGRPIVGYYGNFATWMNYDFIKALSKRRPDINIVMIGHDYDAGKGAFAKSNISDLANVHIIPAQKYQNLKYFSRFFDVGIIPFRDYELTQSVSPVKMFEYMAQQIPTVASGLIECKKYPSCFIAENADDFVNKVEQALSLKNDLNYKKQLRKDAESNTWASRGKAINEAFLKISERTPRKLLTLVVPTYNMQELLPRCLDSMLPPSQLSRLEIIVVNDGSKDNSLEVAKSYEHRYPGTVKVFDKENGGHGSCINVGIIEATGKFFKIVDADDWLNPLDLTIHMNFLQGASVDMIITNYFRSYDDGRNESVSYSERLSEKTYTTDNFYYALMIDNSPASYAHMHAITYRTDILKNNEIRISEKSFYVDQEYITLPQRFINTVAFENIALYRYYIGRPGQSVSPDVARKRAPDNYKILMNIISLAESLPEYSTLKRYVLNIAFHQSWFYLTHSDNNQSKRVLLDWWNNQNTELSNELKQHFTSI